MKAHYERYTPEMVVNKICGTPKDQFLKVCEEIAAPPARARS
jgi:anaerobic selenocysteine-containing dehydrogenase